MGAGLVLVGGGDCFFWRFWFEKGWLVLTVGSVVVGLICGLVEFVEEEFPVRRAVLEVWGGLGCCGVERALDVLEGVGEVWCLAEGFGICETGVGCVSVCLHTFSLISGSKFLGRIFSILGCCGRG